MRFCKTPKYCPNFSKGVVFEGHYNRSTYVYHKIRPQSQYFGITCFCPFFLFPCNGNEAILNAFFLCYLNHQNHSLFHFIYQFKFSLLDFLFNILNVISRYFYVYIFTMIVAYFSLVFYCFSLFFLVIGGKDILSKVSIEK